MTKLTARLLLQILCVSLAVSASAQSPPAIIPVSGTVVDGLGQPMTGLVTCTFALYGDATGGVPLWVEIQAVVLSPQGEYSTLLGAFSPGGVPVNLFATAQAAWLGVQPHGQAENPRVMFVSAPYALAAGDSLTIGGQPLAELVTNATFDATLAESFDAALEASSIGGPDGTFDTLTVNGQSTLMGNVGIGTTSPGAKLEVAGGARLTGSIPLTFSATNPILDVTSGGLTFDATNFDFRHRATAATRLFINTSTGNVGIGTASPGVTLEVAGDAKITGAIPLTFSATNPILDVTSGGLTLDATNFDFRHRATAATRLFINTSTGNVGVGTASPGVRLEVAGDAKITGAIPLTFSATNPVLDVTSGALTLDATNFDFRHRATAATRLFVNTSSGAVGIGTTSPNARLSVLQNWTTAPGSLSLSDSDNSSGAALTFYKNTFGTRVGIIGYDSAYKLWNTQATYMAFATSDAERMRIDPAGNVGVWTTEPTERLHVAGSMKVDGNIDLVGTITARYQDVAEWVETPAPLSDGTVVVIDPTAINRVVSSTRAYDTAVAGAVSAQPGLILGEPAEDKVLIAQSGRVRIKVDASYGAIEPGDLLVTSPTAGHAMRADPDGLRLGTMLGKALEPLDAGRGEILALLTLQ
jgi:hypothetical protein